MTDLIATERLSGYLQDALAPRFTLHHLYEVRDRAAFLADVGSRVRGIVTRATLGVDPEFIDACPGLEIISSRGVGTDRLSVSYAQSRGIVVTNTPSVFSEDVASLGMALVLATTRNIVRNHLFVVDGQWSVDHRPPLSRDLRGSRVGIMGLGRIGKLMAARLAPFGCEIVYHGRVPQPEQPYRYIENLETMAGECHVLIICAPGGDASRGLVGRKVLDALGPEGVLINIGRGSIVDEDELVAALDDGRLGGAGLDVFVDEPNVPGALFGRDNVVLQPHQGGWTVQANRAIDDLVLANITAHFSGRAPPTPVGAP